MKVTIVGASGFIGSHLTKHLLEKTDHELILLAPNAKTISFDPKYNRRVRCVSGSVLEQLDISKALVDTDVVVYLVHMMASKKGDYAELEAQAAEITAQTALAASVSRIIYMGGLGRDDDNLSKHLKSRHVTGDIFRTYLSNVIEFRASMVIGIGSISFEIVRNLIKKLPVLLLPKWVTTKTQPIGISDVLVYMTAAMKKEIAGHEIVEIGGPQVMSYRDFLRKYAHWKGLRRIFIRLTFIPGWLAAWWLTLFMPKRNAKVGRAMVDSFKNPMVVTSNRAREIFPEIIPVEVEESFS